MILPPPGRARNLADAATFALYTHFPPQTKFPPIPPISFNTRPWSPVPFPPLQLPEILIRYQRSRHVSVLTARLPTFPSKSNPGLISSLQKISSLIQPMKVVSKHAFHPYLKHRYYTLFVTSSGVASPWGNSARW